MNRSPLTQRLIFLALLLVVLGGCWWQRGRLLERSRRANAGLQAEAMTLQEQLTAARQQLEGLKASLATQQNSRQDAAAQAAHLLRQATPTDPGDRWTAPPEHLPAWLPDSPYVWLRKDILPSFPIQPFERNGALNPGAGSILVATPEQVSSLNRKLTGLIRAYQDFEVARAEPTDEHPPGIRGAKGEKLTIRVPPLPEEAARLKQEFEATLRTGLGEQRADLLLRAAGNWLDSQFSTDGTLPKTYSVVRHPDGSFNISTSTGGSSMSVGGPRSFEDYIPAHLQPLFAALKVDAASSKDDEPNP